MIDENIVEKGENVHNKYFFSSFINTLFQIKIKFHFSLVSAFCHWMLSVLTNIAWRPLLNDKILDWSKLKAFADDKSKVTQNLKFVLGRVENIVLPAFSPFPTMFSKGFFFRVVKCRDCVVKG